MGNSHGEDAAKAPLLNTVNILTIIRLTLVSVSAVAYLNDAPVRSACAWAVFAAAVFTDKADKHLVCSRNLVTDFGEITGSIAGKTSVSSVLVLLSWHGRLYWWITAIATGRGLSITAMCVMVVKKKVMAAGRGGRIKTFF